MADKSDKPDKKAKSAKSAKDAKSGKKKGGDKAQSHSSIATHPRASAHVRRAKGWGGLAGFAIAGLLSLKAGVPAFDVIERALIFGVVGFLLGWALSVFVWRQLMLAEQRAAAEEIKRRREAAREREAAEPKRKPTPAASGGGGAGAS